MKKCIEFLCPHFCIVWLFDIIMDLDSPHPTISKKYSRISKNIGIILKFLESSNKKYIILKPLFWTNF